MLLTEPRETFRWLPAALRGRLVLPCTPPKPQLPLHRLTFMPRILSLDLHFDRVPPTPDGGFAGLRGHRCDLELWFFASSDVVFLVGGRRLSHREGALPAAPRSQTPPSINLSEERTGHEALPLRQRHSCHPRPRERQASLLGCPACPGDQGTRG